MTETHSFETKKIKPVGENPAYRKAAAATLASIHEAVSPAHLTYLSNRSVAEVEALKEQVAAVIPAGNMLPETALMKLSWVLGHTADHDEVLEVYRDPFNAIVMALFLATMFYHLMLGLQVVIEDYVHSRPLEITLYFLTRAGGWIGMALGVVHILKLALGA